MATRILGISAFYHDSAAALLVDGQIVAAAQEERFTRKKHDHRFPINAVKYCLEQANITPAQLDYAGFYDKPRAKFDRLITTLLAFAPASFQSYITASTAALICSPIITNLTPPARSFLHLLKTPPF